MKGAEFEKPWCMSRFYRRFQLSRSFLNAVCSEVLFFFKFFIALHASLPLLDLRPAVPRLAFLIFFPLLSFPPCLLPASLRLQTGRLLHTPIISIRGRGRGSESRASATWAEWQAQPACQAAIPRA